MKKSTYEHITSKERDEIAVFQGMGLSLSEEEAEVHAAMHYAQRILEDLYDDRATVEEILLAKGRIASA
jgi:hypothetical protein